MSDAEKEFDIEFWKSIGVEIQSVKSDTTLESLTALVKEMIQESCPYFQSYGGVMVPAEIYFKLVEAVDVEAIALRMALEKSQEKFDAQKKKTIPGGDQG
jgi:Na+/H+ antiporter NhaA